MKSPNYNDEARLTIQEPMLRERVPIEWKLNRIVKQQVAIEFSKTAMHNEGNLHDILDLSIDIVAQGFSNAIKTLKQR